MHQLTCVWMRERYVLVEIKFLPTTVDVKAIFGDKLTFLPTIVKEKSYMFSAESEILPTSD